jgi:plasmid stabilization system protein ParE
VQNSGAAGKRIRKLVASEITLVKSGRRFPSQYLQILQGGCRDKHCKKIRSEILVATNQLKRFPDSGQEDLLKKLEEGHRYLAKGHHKIIYKPVEEGILIADVFETRQNPLKINKSKRK